MNRLERNPDQQIARASKIARTDESETGTSISMLVPMPTSVRTLTRPLKRPATSRTTSRPIPRPATSLSEALVVTPGLKMSSSASAAESAAALCGGHDSPRDGGAANRVHVDAGAVVGAGKQDSIRSPLNLKA